MILVIAAGAAAAKVKAGSLASASVVAVRQTVVIGADVTADPPSGVGDLFSIASRDGLALLIAVLFIGGVLTRRIIITDPKAESALVAINSSLLNLAKTVDTNSAKASTVVERLDRIEARLDLVSDRVERVDRARAVKE